MSAYTVNPHGILYVDIPYWKRINGCRSLIESSKAGPVTGLESDRNYQALLLPGVSRSFALTIPALPERLAHAVTNAYLLCRIADTIEDDPELRNEQKEAYLRRFLSVVEGQEDAGAFSASVSPLLSPNMPVTELDLVRNIASVVRVTHALTDTERQALTACVAVMCNEMPNFQHVDLTGLKDLEELSAYCYTVAGAVGEMLVELFCVRRPELETKRSEMRSLAVSFGQGLQMTNILKDVWEDRRRDVCWLPRSVFPDGRFQLERLEEHHRTQAFRDGLNTLIAVAHGHLRNALEFTCHLPPREVGMRRFCLWALGLAVLTLRKIHRNPHYTSSGQVKISRPAVKATVLATNLMLSSDRGLRWLFQRAANGLPLLETAAGNPSAAAVKGEEVRKRV